MKGFRQLAYEITGDPRKYRPETEDEGFGVGVEHLTKHVGSLLFGRELDIMKPCTDDVFLQITHADSEMQRKVIDGTTVNVRRWKFSAVDGDGKTILVRIDSTLNCAGNLLTPGSIVKLQSFLPVYFHYGDSDDKRCAIVVRQFEVVGRRTLAPEMAGAPKQRVEPEKEKKRPTKKARASGAARTARGELAKTEKMTTTPTTNDQCTCDGELCSQHGVQFVTCLTECIPVDSVSLPAGARGTGVDVHCTFAPCDVLDCDGSDVDAG